MKDHVVLLSHSDGVRVVAVGPVTKESGLDWINHHPEYWSEGWDEWTWACAPLVAP